MMFTHTNNLSRASAPTTAGGRRDLPWAWMAIAALVVLGLLLPARLLNAYYLGLAIDAVGLAIAGIGIGFLMHQSGLVLFGVAAFVGLPAYLLGITTTHWGINLSVAVLLALLGTLLFALLVGALVVRTKPLAFAMLTLALAQLLKSTMILQAARPLTGGDDGLSMVFSGTFLGLTQAELGKPEVFWPLAWCALCVVAFISWAVARSRFGQTLRAIKANEERMRFSGFNTYVPRLLAFLLAVLLISIAGVLMGLRAAFVSPEALDFGMGGHSLLAAIIGGPATVGGPILGAVLYTLGQDFFGSTGYLELLTGAAVVIMLTAFPQGAMGVVLKAWSWIRVWFAGRR